jgi:flagellum-specific peptidoglycan hydrolase FlgJ
MTTDPRFLPIIPIATASHAKFYPRGPFISISLAQWALESDYGLHLSGVNNPFGIQANRLQIADGNARLRLSHEWNGKAYIPKEEYFASYLSLIDAFDAHAILLTTPHYARCIAAPTPQDYAMALHYCGYATAPNYAEVLIFIMYSNNLYQFDRGA